MRALALVGGVLLALVALAFAQPHVVAQKSVVGDAVEGRNMTVEIRLWNVGSGMAYNVNVSDANWSDQFVLVEGSTGALFEKIAPGESVKHTYILRPSTYGRMYDLPPATFQYTEGKDDVNAILAYSAVGGAREVLSLSAYYRLHSWRNFFISSVLFLAALGAPAALYGYIQMKYERGVARKSQKRR